MSSRICKNVLPSGKCPGCCLLPCLQPEVPASGKNHKGTRDRHHLKWSHLLCLGWKAWNRKVKSWELHFFLLSDLKQKQWCIARILCLLLISHFMPWYLTGAVMQLWHINYKAQHPCKVLSQKLAAMLIWHHQTLTEEWDGVGKKCIKSAMNQS